MWLCHSVGGHAIVALPVTASRPHQQSSGHHVHGAGDERQVQWPTQIPVDSIRQDWHPVEEIHPCQVAAHGGQSANACKGQEAGSGRHVRRHLSRGQERKHLQKKKSMQYFLPASRWSTPMPRSGIRLRHRQAQIPIMPPRTTRPSDTSGNKNWHRHRSV